MPKTFAPQVAMLVGAAVVGIAGCAGETSSPTALLAPSSAVLALGPTTNATPVVGQIKVCKTGNAAGVFSVSRVAVNGGVGTVLPNPTIPAGECSVVAEDFTTNVLNGSNVTVDETSAGFVSGTVLFISADAGVSGPTTLTDNSTFFVNNYHGYVLTYTNHVTTPPPAAACDFITFGRLVTYTADGTKVVISGNAGGNAPGGGFLGHINVQVGDDKYNVKPITGYGPIGTGALSTKTNSRFASGVATNGALIEVRLYDGGEPGKGTDFVTLTINGVNILAAAGQTIDQGNMQYHANCRGPSDVED